MKEYIKKKAKERGISLLDIANKLGLKSYPSFLRTIETGENLKTKQLVIIAQALGCSIDELVNNKVEENTPTIICPHCGKAIPVYLNPIKEEKQQTT
jgi:transcriptional regulator with XRE-family HTH domain